MKTDEEKFWSHPDYWKRQHRAAIDRITSHLHIAREGEEKK